MDTIDFRDFLMAVFYRGVMAVALVDSVLVLEDGNGIAVDVLEENEQHKTNGKRGAGVPGYDEPRFLALMR